MGVNDQEAKRKHWRIRPQVPAEALERLRTFHPVMAQVLYNRGYDTPEKARVFLEGGDDALHGPFALRGMTMRCMARLRCVG